MLEGHDGLIPVPERALELRGRRASAVVVVLLFLAVLVGTGLVDTFFPAPRPILEGQEANDDAARRRDAKLWDGTLASLFEYDRRVTSSVRRAVTAPYARMLYRWFHFSKAEVIVGQQGWMFLRVRSELGLLPPGEATQRAAARLAALDRALATRGTQLVVAPIPRKSALYSDLMPIGSHPVPELEGLFERSLKQRGITYAPLAERYQAYLDSPEAADGDPLYFNVGTHWTPWAELLAAEEVARAAGLWLPEEERRSSIVVAGERLQDTDTFNFAGFDEDRKSDARLARAKDVALYRILGPLGKPRPPDANPERVGRVALAGTSFSAHRQFAHFLSHFIRLPVYNAAKAGVNPITPVLNVLSTTEPGTPEVLVLELPGHCAFLNNNLSMVEDAYAAVAPAIVYPVPVGRRWRFATEVEEQRPIAVGRRTRLGTLSAGSVAHDGGGVLAIRLSGTVEGAPVRIVVMQGGEGTSALWSAGQESVMVPLIAPLFGAAAVHVSLERTTPGTVVRVQQLELVATIARDSAWTGAFVADGPSAAVAELERTGPLPPRATLVLPLAGAHPSDRLELAVEVDGVWRDLGTFSRLAPRGTIFASLGGHAGGNLTRLRVTGVSADKLEPPFVAPLLPTDG